MSCVCVQAKCFLNMLERRWVRNTVGQLTLCWKCTTIIRRKLHVTHLAMSRPSNCIFEILRYTATYLHYFGSHRYIRGSHILHGQTARIRRWYHSCQLSNYTLYANSPSAIRLSHLWILLIWMHRKGKSVINSVLIHDFMQAEADLRPKYADPTTRRNKNFQRSFTCSPCGTENKIASF